MFDTPLFPLGATHATPAALDAIKEAAEATGTVTALLVYQLLHRHSSGDWGTVCAEDAAANGRALTDGLRILSAYVIAGNVKIWIITEWDRSSTTILLPSDY